MKVLGALALASLCACGGAGEPRPNVLFVSLDDVNDWVSPIHDPARGKPLVATPNLDRLARGGVVFRNAHCSVPFCKPSRASLAAGRQPLRATGEIAEYDDRAHTFDVRTLPQHFADQGYETLCVGKVMPPGDQELQWDHYEPMVRPENQRRRRPPSCGLPLDRSDPLDWGPLDADEEELIDHAVARRAAEILSAERDGPFLLGVGFHLPHAPWYLPPALLERLSGREPSTPIVTSEDLDDVPPIGLALSLDSPTHQVLFPRPGRSSDDTFPDDTLLREAGLVEEATAHYVAATRFADACLGLVLDALESGPHAANTIVVVWSDHGWHLGEKRHWRKRTLWEESTRVPLIFRGPGLARGYASDAPASLVDLYATLVELAELEAPNHRLDGRSLVAELRGAPGPPDAVAFTAYRGNAAVRSRRWRYVRYTDGTEELYDHDTDPMEWHNLAGEAAHATDRDALAARLDTMR